MGRHLSRVDRARVGAVDSGTSIERCGHCPEHVEVIPAQHPQPGNIHHFARMPRIHRFVPSRQRAFFGDPSAAHLIDVSPVGREAEPKLGEHFALSLDREPSDPISKIWARPSLDGQRFRLGWIFFPAHRRFTVDNITSVHYKRRR